MKKKRIIPRLDVKGPNIVKGLCLEGLRIVGKPVDLAKKYYEQGADEILYIDIVASLYERNNLTDVVEQTTSAGIYIPITVGGGIRTLEDIKKILRSGADKVAINTAATKNPNFIKEAAERFGSQCIVGSIEAKKQGNSWEAYVDNGRERTGLDAIEWAKKLVELGSGELLITSVDRDGLKNGYDEELTRCITAAVDVPVIACGGAGSKEDVESCLTHTHCDAVAFGSILHYNKTSIKEVKDYLKQKGHHIREDHKIVNIANNKKKKTISIIDYNVGNMKSIISAFQNIGSTVSLISTPEEVAAAELLVLPGDGAFGYAMEELKKKNLDKAIKHYVTTGKPLLGICLGMQLLLSKSQEFGEHKGLDIIPGEVIPFKPKKDVSDPDYRIPHMGWNTSTHAEEKKINSTIFSAIKNTTEFYFIHSYYVVPKDSAHELLKSVYGGQTFCSALHKNNVYGVQFHPEKSGAGGMSIIEQFSKL
jgi:imidazole glycerol phosphate synthase glutamine amidotransferase subunit